MLCTGIVPEKGCLTSPKSPASTAGNSTPRPERTMAFPESLFLGELNDEVLICSNIAWDLPVESPQEIAFLSRAVCEASNVFTSHCIATGSLVPWRLFQAADRGYHGYVSRSELNRVMLSVSPRTIMGEIDMGLDDDPGEEWLFWDVLVWWRAMDFAPPVRGIIEHNVLNRLVVPSDGLWAGVGLGASIRVWKLLCRSTGYHFRFCAENYVYSMFVRHRDEQIDTSYVSQLELLVYLIQQCLTRIDPKLIGVWYSFTQADVHDRGALNELDLKSFSTLGPKPSQNDQFNPRSVSTDCCESGTLTFIQFINALFAGRLARKVRPILPNHVTRENTFVQFWKRIFKTKQTPPPLVRAQSADSHTIRTYAKQYLDLEQWRGQFVCQQLELS